MVEKILPVEEEEGSLKHRLRTDGARITPLGPCGKSSGE